jgi:hypothetical protein
MLGAESEIVSQKVTCYLEISDVSKKGIACHVQGSTGDLPGISNIIPRGVSRSSRDHNILASALLSL